MMFGWFNAEAALASWTKRTPAFRVCDYLRRQHLDGNRTLQVRIERLVDNTHPAFADLLQRLVMKDRLPYEIDLVTWLCFPGQRLRRHVKRRRFHGTPRLLVEAEQFLNLAAQVVVAGTGLGKKGRAFCFGPFEGLVVDLFDPAKPIVRAGSIGHDHSVSR